MGFARRIIPSVMSKHLCIYCRTNGWHNNFTDVIDTRYYRFGSLAPGTLPGPGERSTRQVMMDNHPFRCCVSSASNVSKSFEKAARRREPVRHGQERREGGRLVYRSQRLVTRNNIRVDSERLRPIVEHNVFIRSRSLSGPGEQTSECQGAHSARVLRRMVAPVQ